MRVYRIASIFKIVFNDKDYGLLISLFAALALAFRCYPYYLQCGSTLPVSLSIWSLFVLFSCLIFTKRPSVIYICGSLLCVNFLLYTGEPHFVIPLTFGAFCLLFYFRTRSRAEKFYSFALIVSCFIFLLLYLVLILPNITSAYDPAHGNNINRFTNALKMTWATKIMVLSFILAFVRFVHVVLTKESASVFDLLLFSSVAYSLSNFVLGLSYTMYYVIPVLVAFVAVFYYSYQYFGYRVTLGLSLAFFVLCSYSLPGKIESRQQDRVTTKKDVYALYDYFKKEQNIYWYKPSLEFAEDKESDGKRELQYESLVELVRWEIGDSTFYMTKVKSFSDSLKGVWLNSIHNERYCKTDTLSMIHYPVVFTSGEINGYLVQ